MAKGEFERFCENGGLELLRRSAEQSASEAEIAVMCGLTLPRFRSWKCHYPAFREALELGLAGADYEVVKALYKKAVGYNVSVNKTYKLKRVDYDPDTGKKLREYEELATGVEETHVPADLRAETFWLKNRQSESWCDRPERSGFEEGDGIGIIEIPEADLIDEEERAE